MTSLISRLFSYLTLALMWLLHWLPLRVTRMLGALLGILLYLAIPERRQIVMTNLRLCFPQQDDSWRRSITRRHFIGFACSTLDRAYFWWSSERRLNRLIRINGREHLKDAAGTPTILLAPHFIGLDAAGVLISTMTRGVSIYSRLKNPVFDAQFYAGRMRFNDPLLLSRQDGVRRVLKALKDGYTFFYLPDMDFGAKDAVFVPFFGVPAATITGVSRLAKLSRANVVPCITQMTQYGYDITLMPAWKDFPGESLEADTRRMNALIEAEVMKMPEQYLWSHKRFKTRPPGEKGVY
ncbi:MAG: lipid A biosynthesis acyltransferase [Georgfuchsia sp.]